MKRLTPSVFAILLLNLLVAAGCKKTQVSDKAPAEAQTAAPKPKDTAAPAPEEAKTPMSYAEMQQHYDQMAKMYAAHEKKLPPFAAHWGARMQMMGAQMGYMHQHHAGWGPMMHGNQHGMMGKGNQHGMMGNQHGMMGKGNQHGMMGKGNQHGMTGNQQPAANGPMCGNDTACGMSGIADWHMQMAEMNRQMAAKDKTGGLADIADQHMMMADQHMMMAKELQGSAAKPAAKAAPAKPAPKGAPSADRGKGLYGQACASCHGVDGKGIASAFPPLAGSEWVKGDKTKLAKIVLGGRVGPITVAGYTYNGAMPGFDGRLSDAQLADILTYARSAWGNGASAVSADEVSKARGK